MAGRDRISELPAEILDKILGFLPIVQAARTAVLSTFWRDTWFSLTQLNFDDCFICHIKKKYASAHAHTKKKFASAHAHTNIWKAGLYVINKVLMQHNGLIRKFAFDFSYPHSNNTPRSRSFDFDQWLLFVTQKGVEEICLSFTAGDEYRLPDCIFSCLMLRRLHLCGVCVEPPINVQCTLPSVTSLCLEEIHFYSRDHPVDAPMLENLSFINCDDYMSDYNITAQKLDSLTIESCCFDQPPVNLDLSYVRTLHLKNFSTKDFVDGFIGGELQLQPPSLNVEYLMLSSNHQYITDISAFIYLLRICPRLCKLDIDLSFAHAMLKLPEEFHTVAERHKMLRTLKLNSFIGVEPDMPLINSLLACFPVLEKVVIIPKTISHCKEGSENDKVEFLHFSCASTNAKIIFGRIL